MFNPEILNDALLNKFVREIGAGDFIFKQGDRGNTMYIIMEGVMKIFYKSLQVNRLVGVCGPGEVLGEKAMLSETPYRRNHSAQATTKVTMLEFDCKSAKTMSGKIPDFNQKILRLVAERLDEANQFIGILQISDPAERLSQYLLHFHRLHVGKGVPAPEVLVVPKEIYVAANLDKGFVEESVHVLIERKIVIKGKKGLFLADEDALMEYLPSLRERVAA